MKPTTFKIFSKLKIGILRKKICLCAMKMLTLGDRCLHIFCTALRKNCNDHLKRQKWTATKKISNFLLALNGDILARFIYKSPLIRPSMAQDKKTLL